jgi:hypothetical protein
VSRKPRSRRKPVRKPKRDPVIPTIPDGWVFVRVSGLPVAFSKSSICFRVSAVRRDDWVWIPRTKFVHNPNRGGIWVPQWLARDRGLEWIQGE